MTAKIQVRRDTSANWNAGTPPTLASGELGLDTTLNQLKAGDNTNPWNTLPWLGGTLPYFSSPFSTDLNDSSNRVMGMYRFSTPASITNGPAAPMDIKAADVGATMMVARVGNVVVQQLWTDGDSGASIPPKSWSRTYDGTNWDAWSPQSNWGISATEGVNAAVRDITVKRNATVDNDLTVTGDIACVGEIDVQGTFKSTNPLPALSMSLGCVVQVVHVESSAQTTLTSALTWTNLTGLSASITPTRATNKIMVILSVSTTVTQTTVGQNPSLDLRVQRTTPNAATVNTATAVARLVTQATGTNVVKSVATVLAESTAQSLALHTFQVQAQCSIANLGEVNTGGSRSSITLVEIAAT